MPIFLDFRLFWDLWDEECQDLSCLIPSFFSRGPAAHPPHCQAPLSPAHVSANAALPVPPNSGSRSRWKRGSSKGRAAWRRGPGKLGSKAGMSQSVSKYLFSARQLGGYREIIRRHPVPGWVSGRVPRIRTRPGAGACPARGRLPRPGRPAARWGSRGCGKEQELGPSGRVPVPAMPHASSKSCHPSRPQFPQM